MRSTICFRLLALLAFLSVSGVHVNAAAKEDGGWRLPDTRAKKELKSPKCNIDRISAASLTREVFMRDYWLKKPLILTFENQPLWTDRSYWTRKAILNTYGKQQINIGRSDFIVRSSGSGYEKADMVDYMEEFMDTKDEIGEPFYMFDRDFYTNSKLPATIKIPEVFAPLQEQEANGESNANIFFFGASFSGVSFHRHHNAINFVVYGNKRWFLYPPSQTPPGGFWPGWSMLHWLKEIYPKLDSASRPVECVQEASEVFYVPEGWYHGVLNVGDTIAVGYQMNTLLTDYMQKIYALRKSIDKLGVNEDIDTGFNRLKNDIQSLLDEDGGSAESLALMAQLEAQYARKTVGDITNAVETYKKAIEKEPNYINAMTDLARFLGASGRPDSEVRPWFEAGIKKNPRNFDANEHYANYLYHKLEHQDLSVEDAKLAIKMYETCIKLRDQADQSIYAGTRDRIKQMEEFIQKSAAKAQKDSKKPWRKKPPQHSEL